MGFFDGLLERADSVFTTFDTAVASIVSHLPGDAAAVDEHYFPIADEKKRGVQQNPDGSVSIGNATLSKQEAEEARNAGICLSFLNEGQAAEVHQAYVIDCNIIENPDGSDLDEMCRKKEAEPDPDIDDDDEIEDVSLYYRNMLRPGRGSVFVEQADAMVSGLYENPTKNQTKAEREREREQQRERRKQNQAYDNAGEKAALNFHS